MVQNQAESSTSFFMIDLIFCDLWYWMVCVWFNHFV